MRVLVIGGTGFIGYHIVQTLAAAGMSVQVLSRQPERAAAWFPAGVTGVAGDIDALETGDYERLLAGIDGVVFAAGADERSKVEGDAEPFFFRANVQPCERLFAAVARSGVRRAVLLNSVFAWLDAAQPELGLARQHCYIRSRVVQDRVSHDALRGSACVLTTLQVPWVFGASPLRSSQWESLVQFVRAAVPLMCIRGGANMLSVQSLAEAVRGALLHPVASSTLPVGDENLTYVELMQRLCPLVRRRDNQVRLLPDSFFRDLTAIGHYFSDVFGIQSGIELQGMGDLLLRDIFFDPAPGKALLQYAGGDLDEALAGMVAAIPESVLMAGWRRSINWFTWR